MLPRAGAADRIPASRRGSGRRSRPQRRDAAPTTCSSRKSCRGEGPATRARWQAIGGSDAHTLRRVGRTWRSDAGRNRAEFLDNLARDWDVRRGPRERRLSPVMPTALSARSLRASWAWALAIPLAGIVPAASRSAPSLCRYNSAAGDCVCQKAWRGGYRPRVRAELKQWPLTPSADPFRSRVS